MIRAIVTDIEGTTSSLSFVRDVLFPYARKNLGDFIRKHEKDVAGIMDDIRTMENNTGLSTDGIISLLIRWIDEDRKATPLKALQGMIWKAGYEAGDFRGHIYDDAVEALQRWHKAGIALYVYSSGSVAAQKLLFSHTPRGDLTPLFSGYFDTATGPKLEVESYRNIAAHIGAPAGAVLFLSDNPGEIDAAAAAGMQTVLINRPEDLNADSAKITKYRTARNFHDIIAQEKAA